MKTNNQHKVAASETAGRTASGKPNELPALFLAHELRAPLADLLTLVRHQCYGVIKVAAYQAIVEHIQSLSCVVDGLLSDQQDLDTDKHFWISPDDEICSLIRTLNASAMDKKIHLSYKSELSPRQQIHIKTQALQIVVRNLLSNAINNTERGEIEIRSTANSEGLQVSIQDSGPGLPAPQADYLEGRRDRPCHAQGGRGIGLLLTRNAIEALGAEAKVQLCYESDHSQIVEPGSARRAKPSRKESRTIAGTCCNIQIPGPWRVGQWSEKKEAIPADLSGIHHSQEIYSQLTALGLYHDPGVATSILLKQNMEPVPHLLCVDSLQRNHRLNYPFSQGQLRALIGKVSEGASPEQRALPSISREDAGGMRIILVIDDSSINRKMLVDIFYALGWLAHEAEDGDVAAQKLSRVNYDLIVQDAHLPGACVPDCNIPKIATSAIQKSATELCQTTGHWLGVLSKPFNQEELRGLLSEWEVIKNKTAWDPKLGAKLINSHDKEALELAKKVITDLLSSWSQWTREVSNKNTEITGEISHRILGGLRYTGLKLLTDVFEEINIYLMEGRLPDKEKIIYIKE